MIHVLWALSRVQVKESLEITLDYSVDNEPINLLMTNVLRRVNPDYGYKLKIVAREYCDEFLHMLLNFPLINKTLLIKDDFDE